MQLTINDGHTVNNGKQWKNKSVIKLPPISCKWHNAKVWLHHKTQQQSSVMLSVTNAQRPVSAVLPEESQVIGKDITIHPELLCLNTGHTKPQTLTSRWRRTVQTGRTSLVLGSWGQCGYLRTHKVMHTLPEAKMSNLVITERISHEGKQRLLFRSQHCDSLLWLRVQIAAISTVKPISLSMQFTTSAAPWNLNILLFFCRINIY